MKTRLTLVIASLFLACVAALPCLAAPPGIVNYQGRLVQGTNLVNANVSVVLRVFDAASVGSLLFADSIVVTVVDGLYATWIGDNSIAGSMDNVVAASNAWLEVEINGQTLSPREQLGSVPYALASRQAAHAAEADRATNAVQIQGAPVSTNLPAAGQILRFDGLKWGPAAETDPVWAGASNLYYLKVQADGKFATGTPVYA